jgi:hypothetical protein
MDAGTARAIAITRFTRDGQVEIHDWVVRGPRRRMPWRKPASVLMFSFRPRKGASTHWDRRWPPLLIAVDPLTGDATPQR